MYKSEMSRKRKALLIFFLCCFSISFGEIKNGCFFNRIKGHEFQGNVLQNVKATDDLDCCSKCKRLKACSSINFAHDAENGLHKCVLMGGDAKSNGGRLVSSQVYHHFTRIDNKCTTILCENGGTCSRSAADTTHCHCLHGFTGNRCETKDNWWEKINSIPVCFGTKNSSYGSFHIKQPGQVTTVQLKHLSGLMTCIKESPTLWSPWGCGENVLYTIITDIHDQRILPQDEFITHYPWLQYSIPGVNRNSTELTFKSFSTPLKVTAGQEYRIWFGQDLTNNSENNNDGGSCVDVYMFGWFA